MVRDALPKFIARPCPYSSDTPPDVGFVFHGADGGVVLRAVAHLPGTCAGAITSKGHVFAEDSFVGRSRVKAHRRRLSTQARSPNEKVPAGVRTIAISGPRKPARRITRPEQVARIVHWFDSLPVTGRRYDDRCTILIRYPPPPPVKTIDFLGADGREARDGDGGISLPVRWSTSVSAVTTRHRSPAGTCSARIEHLPR